MTKFWGVIMAQNYAEILSSVSFHRVSDCIKGITEYSGRKSRLAAMGSWSHTRVGGALGQPLKIEVLCFLPVSSYVALTR